MEPLNASPSLTWAQLVRSLRGGRRTVERGSNRLDATIDS